MFKNRTDCAKMSAEDYAGISEGFSQQFREVQFPDSYSHNFGTGSFMNSQHNFNSNPAVDFHGPFRVPKRRGRPIANNAARERSRVKTLRTAFLELQRTLPAVPPDTKLSKLDVLVLATTYIAHLMSALHEDGDISHIFAANGCMHPVKKWPMRTRLYAGILSSTLPNGPEPEEQTSTSDMTPYQEWQPDSV